MLLICSRSRAYMFALIIIMLALAAVAAANDHASPVAPGETPTPAVATAGGGSLALTVRTVTIIESQSENSGHDMDAEWLAVATALGHTAAIAGQSTLDDVANLAGTDILIVSSGVTALPAARVATILAFLMDGGQVYLQGEYLCDFTTNLGFGSLVASLGGAYTPTGTVSGMLEPMAVIGSLGTTPNVVPTMMGFWYGCAGTGDATLTPFLEYNGQDFGFVFTPPNSAYGHIVYDTDQDWVREADGRPTSVDLMENILAFLADPGTVAVESARWGDVKAMYR